jgi:hypothetical protein
MASELTDKQILQQWNEYVENVRKSTALLTGENEEQQRRRIKILEDDPELWFKYYFPSFAYAEPAPFHKAATKRIVKNLEWFEVRSWSRELAKSTRTMMEILYLCLTGKKKYVLLISNSYDNAERLLMPYRGQLAANQRMIHDYGVQELPGKWEAGEFTTRKGAAFRALGAGQSPRGTRNEEARPDVIIFDDIDTDEDVRNPDIIKKRWEWIEKAAIGTRSISTPTTIIFCGNIIAKECCVVKAQEYADHVDVVNIRDEEGRSSWPQKNSEEQIDRVLSQKSYNAQQGEYYNNPIEDGDVFEEMYWGKCPPLSKLQFVVVYGDPSTANNNKPTRTSRNKNSCKAVVIVGYNDLKFYVYNAWVDVTTNSHFIDWLYASRSYINGKCLQYTFIENNGLQNPFYEQVLLPMINSKGKEQGGVLGVTPDDRDKPDKFFRIEANLEPENSNGRLILNAEEKDNPHMKRLEAQFKSVSPNSRTMDGPDAVEGAVQIIKNKISVAAAGGIQSMKRQPNNKRF